MTNSNFFKQLTYWVMGIGALGGVVAGNVYKAVVSEKVANRYAGYSEQLAEKFNVFLMVQVWVSFAILAAVFWAIHCHLSNQERMIFELQNIKKELYKTND